MPLARPFPSHYDTINYDLEAPAPAATNRAENWAGATGTTQAPGMSAFTGSIYGFRNYRVLFALRLNHPQLDYRVSSVGGQFRASMAGRIDLFWSAAFNRGLVRVCRCSIC